MNKRRIITSALKFRHGDSRRVKWWLKDESLIPVTQSVVAAIRDITKQDVRPNIKIIKQNERKTVFRMEYPQDARQSFIAKVFFLNSVKHRFKYYKYGLDETANLLRARNRGINTPEVYGYGNIHDMFGLVKTSVIILEDLQGQGLSPIGVLMRTKSEDERSEVFMRSVSLFAKLYETGCNHIDVNSGAVMLSEDHLDSEVYLLDFQHAKFYSTPSSEILMFEAGHFARSCCNWISAETINKWLAKVLDAIEIRDNVSREKLIERFDYYFAAQLSRKARKKIS